MTIQTLPTTRVVPYAALALIAAAPIFASAALLTATGTHYAFTPPVVPTPTAPTTPALDESDGATASFNWAGYAAQGEFNGVSGTWIVPSISVSGTRGSVAADATWVGIGGVESTDLIQAGTQATVQNGAVRYRAWYELLPGYMTFVPLDVNAGDTMAASITERGIGQWQISIHDQTTGKNYSTTAPYDSSQSSVEWIEERPSTDSGELLSLDNFNSVQWQSASATRAAGAATTADALNAQSVTMYSRNGEELAAPTALGENGSFSVSRAAPQPVSQSMPQPYYQIIPHVIPPNTPAPSVPSSVSESVTQSSANGTHGEYSVYIDGKLVDHEAW